MRILTGRHEDIINLSRPESRRPKMSMRDRAAQFSPFVALTGHDAAINETARRVDKKIELSDEEQTELDRKMQRIIENPDSAVEITYFVPDKKKQDGAYVTSSGVVVKIDMVERKLIMSDNAVIPFDDVLEINGEIFENMFE